MPALASRLDLSLVAFYGPAKPAALRTLIAAVQRSLCALGDAFVPYAEAQVHATLIGLEGLRTPSDALLNANFLAARAESRVMQLEAALAAVRRHLPITVQLGGFARDASYPFQSRGQHPYLRSFSIQGPRAVMIGWPGSPVLGQLRRELASFGVLHKYHAAPDAFDNDCFFVLGELAPHATVDGAVSEAIRSELARTPVELAIDVPEVQLVHYRDPTLPPESTLTAPLAAADALSLLT